jgi:hypothetical protein
MIGPRKTARVTVFHPTGTDDDGNPQGVTTTNVPARIEYRQQLIRTATGEQKPSRATVTLEANPRFGGIAQVWTGDILTLPDGSVQPVLDAAPNDGLGGRILEWEVKL